LSQTFYKTRGCYAKVYGFCSAPSSFRTSNKESL